MNLFGLSLLLLHSTYYRLRTPAKAVKSRWRISAFNSSSCKRCFLGREKSVRLISQHLACFCRESPNLRFASDRFDFAVVAISRKHLPPARHFDPGDTFRSACPGEDHEVEKKIYNNSPVCSYNCT